MMIKSFTYLFIILSLEIAVCFSQVDLPFTEGVREIFISSAFFALNVISIFPENTNGKVLFSVPSKVSKKKENKRKTHV